MVSATLHFMPVHAPGMAGIAYAGKGDNLRILSCGQDGQLCIHNSRDLSDKTLQALEADAVACHCLAVSPAQDTFAVGNQAHFVKVRELVTKLLVRLADWDTAKKHVHTSPW